MIKKDGWRTVSVESPGPSERFVERFGKVGRSDNDDAFGLLETVKLDQQLVESLLHVMLRRPFSWYSACESMNLT